MMMVCVNGVWWHTVVATLFCPIFFERGPVAARFIRISQHVISDASDIDKACL